MKFKIIKRSKFIKHLIIIKKRISGRSNLGRLIAYGRGGGFLKYYRLIDFKRLIFDIPARVLGFEYDPNRNNYIMKVLYFNGVLTYNLTPLLVYQKMFLINSPFLFCRWNGNSMYMINCSIGSFIHGVKLLKIQAQYGRAAGVYVQFVRKFGPYALIRLPSKEERFIWSNSMCIIGRLSNKIYKLLKYSSAGYNRRKGKKPKVRGVAKNPIDHPHGGGEGRTTAGQPSVSPWGIYTKGVRTTTRFLRKNLIGWGFFKRRRGFVW